MTIDKVFVENWSRLQCASVHVTFSSPDLTNSVQMHLTPTELRFSFKPTCRSLSSDVCISIPTTLCINANSLSRVIQQSGYVSFRVCTDRAKAFDEEFLSTKLPRSLICDHARLKLQPSVAAHERLVLGCASCSQPLTPMFAFERVLELPSDNMDLDEWFCHHHHDGDQGHSHAPKCDADDGSVEIIRDTSNSGKITALPHDLLYGQFYFVMSNDLFAGSLIVSNDSVQCRHCKVCVGEFQPRNDTVKLWNELIAFKTTPDVRNPSAIAPAKHLFAGTLFDQFMHIVRKIIEDFDFLTSTVSVALRFVFEHRRPRSAGQPAFLLVQVMNTNLELWLNEMPMKDDDVVQLRRIDGMKVMYQVFAGDTEPPSALVNSWLKDTAVNHIQISAQMMRTAVDRFVEHARLVPECYRQSGIDGFLMSYLF